MGAQRVRTMKELAGPDPQSGVHLGTRNRARARALRGRSHRMHDPIRK